MEEIRHIGHAGFCIETDDEILLIDPWLGRNGAFDRSWFQLPSNENELSRLLGIVKTKDLFIYITHEHEDHFCKESLAALGPYAKEIIIPNYDVKSFRNEVESVLDATKITELDEESFKNLGSLKLCLFIDEGGINRDSAVLVQTSEGFTFFNQNDCKIHDRLGYISKKYGKIDAYACQFSGATMHPICYEISDEEMGAIAKKKKNAKFRGVLSGIQKLEPDFFIFSAGPACFLDPELFHLNFLKETSFPCAWEFERFLIDKKVKSDLSMSEPGDRLIIKGKKAEVSLHSGSRLTEESLESYLRKYQEKNFKRPVKEIKDRSHLVDALILNLSEKLSPLKKYQSLFEMPEPLYFKLDERELIKICFDEISVRVVPETNEDAYYIHHARLENLVSVVENEMSWSTYYLSFRFKNQRLNSEYQVLRNLYMFSNDGNEFDYGIRKIIEFKESKERVTFEVDGKKVSCIRFCPHQGADLKYAEVEDGKVICPRHYWQFDLKNKGKCTLNNTTVDARDATS